MPDQHVAPIPNTGTVGRDVVFRHEEMNAAIGSVRLLPLEVESLENPILLSL